MTVHSPKFTLEQRHTSWLMADLAVLTALYPTPLLYKAVRNVIICGGVGKNQVDSFLFSVLKPLI